MTSMRNRTCLLGLCLCCLGGAMAAGPAPQTQGGVVYLCGGVGQDEQQLMLAARPDYPLRMTFATKGSGAYQADVAVTIRDRSGATVASFVAAGPVCYVRLAPATYRVLARVRGQELAQTAVVKPPRPRALYFYWDPE